MFFHISLKFKSIHIRLISWSKPIRDSEGRTPSLIGRGPEPVRVCAFENVCAAAVRQREVSRDACSVANLARFSAFLGDITTFFLKRLVTNLAISWTNSNLASLSECLCDLIRISVEGPSLEDVDARDSVSSCFSQGQRSRRPNYRSWPSEGHVTAMEPWDVQFEALKTFRLNFYLIYLEMF